MHLMHRFNYFVPFEPRNLCIALIHYDFYIFEEMESINLYILNYIYIHQQYFQWLLRLHHRNYCAFDPK